MSKTTRDAATPIGEGKGGLMQGLRAAQAKAEADQQELIKERLIEYHREIYGSAAAYESTVILAGYAAFFTLWVGVNADVSPLCRLVTVALMGTSLMFYMIWHIIQMLTRQTYEFQKAAAFKFVHDPVRFNDMWKEVDHRHEIASARVLRLWPWTFVPSLVLGFAAGIVLSYNALAAILGWPQLR